MFDIGAGIGVVSGIAGLLGGKKSTSTKTSTAVSKLLESSAKRLSKTDPYADVESALNLSQLNVQKLAEQALNNVFARYSVAGSRSDLPDSARSGVLRGVLGDIMDQRQQIEADARLNALPRYLQMVAQLVGQATPEGRGAQTSVKQPINASAFAKDVSALIDSLRKK